MHETEKIERRECKKEDSLRNCAIIFFFKLLFENMKPFLYEK